LGKFLIERTRECQMVELLMISMLFCEFHLPSNRARRAVMFVLVQIVMPFVNPIRIVNTVSAVMMSVIDEQRVVTVSKLVETSVRAKPTVRMTASVVVTKVVVPIAKRYEKM
jgi:hypothetical protein